MTGRCGVYNPASGVAAYWCGAISLCSIRARALAIGRLPDTPRQ